MTFSNKQIYFALLIITFIGAFLRLYGLEIQSLWYDELCSLKYAQVGNPWEVYQFSKSLYNAPGYNVFLSAWIGIFGASPTVLRMPSVIAGILSIPLMFQLGKLLYSPKLGLASALLMSFLYTPIYFSQEARTYSILLFLVLLFTICWIHLIRALKSGDRLNPLYVATYLVAVTLAAYAHYFGLLLVGLQGMGMFLFFLILKNKKGLLWSVLIYSIFLLLYLPWLIEMFQDFDRDEFWANPVKGFPFIPFLEFLFNRGGLLIFVLVFYAGFFLDRFILEKSSVKEKFFSTDFFLLLWLVVPFLILYIKSVLSTPMMINRYLLISLPPAYILLARSIDYFISKNKRFYLFFTIFSFLLLYQLIFIKQYFKLPQKEQTAEFISWVVHHKDDYPNHLIVGELDTTYNYYFNQLDTDIRALDYQYFINFNDPIQNIQEIKKRVKKENQEFIILLWNWNGLPKRTNLLFNKHFEYVEKKEFFKSLIVIYKVREKPPQ